MALPESRNTTYAAGSQVKSADLNDVQDKIIDAYVDGPHGDRILLLPAAAGQGTVIATGHIYAGIDGVTSSSWAQGGSGDYVECPIPLRIGDRIKSVRAFVRDTTAAHTLSLKVRKSTNTNNNSQLGSTATSAGNGADQTLEVASLTETLATGELVHALIRNDDGTTTTHKIYGVEVTYDRPAP